MGRVADHHLRLGRHIHPVRQVLVICDRGCVCPLRLDELPLGSSGRISRSPTIPRFASSADAVRLLSSQAS